METHLPYLQSSLRPLMKLMLCTIIILITASVVAQIDECGAGAPLTADEQSYVDSLSQAWAVPPVNAKGLNNNYDIPIHVYIATLDDNGATTTD